MTLIMNIESNVREECERERKISVSHPPRMLLSLFMIKVLCMTLVMKIARFVLVECERERKISASHPPGMILAIFVIKVARVVLLLVLVPVGSKC
jgi:uncharacterized membrane protein YidH (DUF202 family)